MRVSDSQMHDLIGTSVGTARARVAAAQEHAIEGKRVIRPSDDPVAAAQARRASARIARAESDQRNIVSGTSSLQAAEGALSQASDVLTRIREIAIEQANGTLGPEERAAAAREVHELRESMRDLANTKVEGRYVFSGYAEDTAPFDVSGAYVGHAAARDIEVGPGVRLQAGVTGDRVFSPAGGVDLFATMDSLEAALAANDQSAVSGTLDDLDRGLSQINDGRAQLGALMNHFDVARSVSERIQDHETEVRSDLVDADMVSTFMGLSEAQSALQAAIQIAGQLPLPGLVDR